ncbi:hypothetical protein [Mesorhizobium sp. M7A.F.Ca.CA.004.02.1.1]|uniref:hypothetical protein n=1 Tax=Mesorhizobium sp. M7A.F.Ca.CA.004.02.1.1 TaxID=2496690 RepID=UPI000FCBB74A|nr:hypothetical protein [Mesorhizobium sp. M7A.F.Ca.CA.004.02.1.1]RVB05681.1 hypothetical protein EN912_02140 [Mesorhizobium sp. M7A.F.Ca.CA.004.02.1.1]
MNITAQNTFTAGCLVQAGDVFDVSISGTFVATVVVQRSKDNVTFFDVESFTAAAEKTGYAGSAYYFRIGVKTGGFTSGTVVVELHR